MNERLLAAEGALSRDELDHAQRLFGQVVEADPRNAIAVVGLARVLNRRGDTAAARELLAHALEIDPDEAAARRLIGELDAGTALPAGEPAGLAAAPDGVLAVAPLEDAPPAPLAQPRGLVARLRRLFRLG